MKTILSDQDYDEDQRPAKSLNNRCWIQTFTGRVFRPFDARPDICIEDIAHALALTCRFGGMAKKFYSVAQHSVEVSRLVEKTHPEHAMNGLFHDAAEAFVGDMVSPLKRLAGLRSFRAIEDKILTDIFDHFGITGGITRGVKRADLTVLAAEVRDLMGGETVPWELPSAVLGPTIVPVSPEVAEQEFITRYEYLTRLRAGGVA